MGLKQRMEQHKHSSIADQLQSRLDSFKTGRKASKSAGQLQNWLEVVNQALTYISQYNNCYNTACLHYRTVLEWLSENLYGSIENGSAPRLHCPQKKQAQTVRFLLIITKLVENMPTVVSTTNLLEVNQVYMDL